MLRVFHTFVVLQMELAVDLWRFRVGLLLRSVSPRMVQAHFGVCLESLAVIWSFVHQHFADEGLRGLHLLWVLFFLRVYPTEDQAANFCVTADIPSTHMGRTSDSLQPSQYGNALLFLT
jgi:hypothetical protein